MGSKQIAAVAVFSLGILALLFSISIVQAVVTIPYYPEEFEGKLSLIIFAYIFPLILLLTTGLMLIFKRHQLAAWIISESETEESRILCESPDLPALLFAILGIYLVISTLPELGGLAGQLISFRASPESDQYVQVFWSNLGHYVGTLVQFVAGAYLFLGARGLGRWWGSRKQQPEPLAAERILPNCPQCGTPFDPSDYQAGTPEKRCSRCNTVLPESEFTDA